MKQNFAVIILAAGDSSRAGFAKGLYKINGEYCISHTLNLLYRLNFLQIVLVTGKHTPEYKKALLNYSSLIICENKNPHIGPFLSIQLGLQSAVHAFNPDGFFLLPIDTPAPKAEVWINLAKTLEAPIEVVSPQTNGGKGGHPVLISKKIAMQIINSDAYLPESRLDFFLKALPAQKKCRVLTDDTTILLNLNTAEDWDKFSKLK